MNIIPISRAKGHLAEVVRDSEEGDVILMRHGRPAAVVMGIARHEALLEALADAQDRLSIHEREGVTIDIDKLANELGIEV